MNDLTLNCVLIKNDFEPVDDIFRVRTSPSDLLADIKDKIYETRRVALNKRNLEVGELELWKPSVALPSDWGDLGAELNRFRPDQTSREGVNKKVVRLNPLLTVERAFSDPLPNECVHLLVRFPAPVQSSSGKKEWSKRLKEEATETLLTLRTKRTKISIPPLCDLRAFLERPLSDEEKISISNDSFNFLHGDPTDETCSEEDVAILFKRADLEALSQLSHFYTAAAKSPPAIGTEEYFRGVWDSNIKDIIETVLQQARTIRNSNEHTATRGMRPDFGLVINNVCVFRGKEKPPVNTADPGSELVDKLTWVYRPAKYLLGYYCCGLEMTLVAICEPSGPRVKPTIHKVCTADLRFRRDRIANLRRMINLSSLMRPLADIVQTAGPAEYQPMQMELSTVELTASCIVKAYTCPDAVARVEHLKSIYELLHHHHVPNTDYLASANHTTVYLTPRGIPVAPGNEEDLQRCIICILETLVVLHNINVIHRDIRWPNIIQNAEDPNNWILIDWEDATNLPTKGQTRSRREDYSPSLFEDNHSTEVDIWAVGHLITTSHAADISPAFKTLGEYICESAHLQTAQKIRQLVLRHPLSS